ncbi:hypothetical protein ACHAXT_009943 [Thalassiosira profunda]
MLTSSACRSIGGLASRSSSRHASTLARAAVSSGAAAPPSLASRQHDVASRPPASASPPRRSLSSMGGMMPRRGYPQYTIFGPDTALGLRASLPQFKRAGTDGVSVDRRGKLVMEFIPRNNTGAGFAWNDKVLFSLSVEEVGLLLSQLPGNTVELSHQTRDPNLAGEEGGGYGVAQLSGDAIDKVMTIEPGEGATLTFKVDYVKDGVGGQTPPGADTLPTTPLEITIQAGEFEVVKSICQTSIPYLLGWNTTMDIASAAAMSRGLSGGGGGMY